MDHVWMIQKSLNKILDCDNHLLTEVEDDGDTKSIGFTDRRKGALFLLGKTPLDISGQGFQQRLTPFLYIFIKKQFLNIIIASSILSIHATNHCKRHVFAQSAKSRSFQLSRLLESFG